MMSITYRGYFGEASEIPQGGYYVGHVLDIPEDLTFSGRDSDEIIESFEACIDGYIAGKAFPTFIPLNQLRLIVQKFQGYGWELDAIANMLNQSRHTCYTPQQLADLCEK